MKYIRNLNIFVCSLLFLVFSFPCVFAFDNYFINPDVVRGPVLIADFFLFLFLFVIFLIFIFRRRFSLSSVSISLAASFIISLLLLFPVFKLFQDSFSVDEEKFSEKYGLSEGLSEIKSDFEIRLDGILFDDIEGYRLIYFQNYIPKLRNSEYLKLDKKVVDSPEILVSLLGSDNSSKILFYGEGDSSSVYAYIARLEGYDAYWGDIKDLTDQYALENDSGLFSRRFDLDSVKITQMTDLKQGNYVYIDPVCMDDMKRKLEQLFTDVKYFGYLDISGRNTDIYGSIDSFSGRDLLCSDELSCVFSRQFIAYYNLTDLVSLYYISFDDLVDKDFDKDRVSYSVRFNFESPSGNLSNSSLSDNASSNVSVIYYPVRQGSKQ